MKLKIGDIVSCWGQDFKVARIEPLVYGVRKTRGGKWSKREYCLHNDWIEEQIYKAKLSIGCIVIVCYAEFKVTRADFTHKKPWLWGISKYKNGEFGENECCLYSDWELK